jgi:hypothetical protein
MYFPSSIHTTDKEPQAWHRFWETEGLDTVEVAYEKNIRDSVDLPRAEVVLTHPRTRALALIVDKVDRIMHGMELGSAGMHNQVRQWMGQGVLVSLLEMLLGHGFDVWLTADHGNIEARGCGMPREGVTADLRSTRARIYPDTLLRGEVKERFPDAIEWPHIGLPENYLPLIAPDRLAFVRETETLVGHGGITVEEVMVPFVRVTRSGP